MERKKTGPWSKERKDRWMIARHPKKAKSEETGQSEPNSAIVAVDKENVVG